MNIYVVNIQILKSFTKPAWNHIKSYTPGNLKYSGHVVYKLNEWGSLNFLPHMFLDQQPQFHLKIT